MTLFIIILAIFGIYMLYLFAQVAIALLSIIKSIFLLIIKLYTGRHPRYDNPSNTPKNHHSTSTASSFTHYSTSDNHKHRQQKSFDGNNRADKKPPNQTIQPIPKTLKTQNLSSLLILDLLSVLLDVFG